MAPDPIDLTLDPRHRFGIVLPRPRLVRIKGRNILVPAAQQTACRRHAREEYEHRYVANPDGLIGDVAAKKRWHEHFSRRKLEGLLDRQGFSVVAFDGTGFFVRLLKIAELLFGRIALLRRGIRRIMAWDARRFESANLFCLAQKRTGAPRGPK